MRVPLEAFHTDVVEMQSGPASHPGALRAAEAFGLHLSNVAGS